VTALSHEIARDDQRSLRQHAHAELAVPGLPATSSNARPNLEEGDPIEVLPSRIPITLRERRESVYLSPEIIPFVASGLRWEQRLTPSAARSAIGHDDFFLTLLCPVAVTFLCGFLNTVPGFFRRRSLDQRIGEALLPRPEMNK